MPRKKQVKSNKYFELWELLARTQHAIYNARETQLREHGVTPTQAYILLRVSQLNNKATQAQIANFIFRKQNTVSVNVKRMEKQGLLKRNRNKNQKNLITLSLTKKGEEIYQKTLNRDSINNIMASLSTEQIEQMRDHLETLFTAAATELAKFSNDSFLKNILKNFSRT